MPRIKVGRVARPRPQPPALQWLRVNASSAGGLVAGQGDRHDVFVVARNIRALRLRDGLTQGELAARLGVLPAQVSKWESGVHRLSDASLGRYTEYFDVSPDVIRGIGCPGADLSGRSSAAVRIVDSVTRHDDGVECHASGEVGPVPTELAARHPSAFLFRVMDDSMSLLFVRNALVLIDPDVSLPRGSHVGLVAPNGAPSPSGGCSSPPPGCRSPRSRQQETQPGSWCGQATPTTSVGSAWPYGTPPSSRESTREPR